MTRCSVCNTRVADEASVCHVCNSALAGSGPDGAADQAAVHTRIVELESEHDRNTRIVDVGVPAVVRRAARRKERAPEGRQEKPDADDEHHSLLDQLQERIDLFYVRMHRLDRWAWWSLVGVALATFLPWHAAEGVQLEAGIEGFGLVTLFAATAALAAIHGRTVRRRLSRRLMLAQIGATALVFAAPVRLAMNTDPQHLKFGVMIATALAFVATALALVRLMRLRQPE